MRVIVWKGPSTRVRDELAQGKPPEVAHSSGRSLIRSRGFYYFITHARAHGAGLRRGFFLIG